MKAKKLIISSLFALSFATSALTADAATGIVNIGYLLNQDPEFISVTKELAEDHNKAQAEFNQKAAKMSMSERKTLAQTYEKDLEAKSDKLLAPFHQKIYDAVAKVAKAHNLDTVVVSGAVVYGNPSIDITQEVQKVMKK